MGRDENFKLILLRSSEDFFNVLNSVIILDVAAYQIRGDFCLT